MDFLREIKLKRHWDTGILILLIGLFVVVLVRTAWVSDDAYITFRTVDNFVHGYGLSWNVGERVQSYTHPLWMFLVAGFYFLTGEIYYTNILLSIVLSFLAVVIFSLKIARSRLAAIIGVTALLFSKAFIDYSTSGLENALTNLLLVCFFVVYLRWDDNPKKLFVLSFLASLSVLNRMDNVLLLLPCLVYSVWQLKTSGILRKLGTCLVGFLPFIIWELFSLFYYGFLFPNTAYAKLNTGISNLEYARQGLYYLIDSIKMDPVTLTVIAVALLMALITRQNFRLPIAVGIIFYILYIVRVGGDFMSGRFLTSSFLCAVILASTFDINYKNKFGILGVIAIVLLGLLSPGVPLLSGADYGKDKPNLINPKGIADERAFYYYASGLLNMKPQSQGPDHICVKEGIAARNSNETVAVQDPDGFFGFFAGPNIHIIDTWGLSEPLLARLPIMKGIKIWSELDNPYWRIGHFSRMLPEGYLETIVSKRNVIKDPKLALYYDKLSLIIKGPLFDRQRLIEIWNFNLGKYDHLINREFYSNPKNLKPIHNPRFTWSALYGQGQN